MSVLTVLYTNPLHLHLATFTAIFTIQCTSVSVARHELVLELTEL